MEHSALRQRNELTTFYVLTEIVNPTITIFKLSSDNSVFEELNTSSIQIQHVQGNEYKANYLTPDEDCHLCILFGDYPIVTRIGNPSYKFIYFGSPNTVYSFVTSENNTGNLLELGSGFYYIPTSIDESIIEINGESYLFNIPYSTSQTAGSSGAGEIELDIGASQIIAIPVEFGYWDDNQHKLVHDGNTRSTVYNYVVKQLEDKYSLSANNMFSVCNAKIGDSNRYYNYVPGLTSPTSVHNFPLIYNDNGKKEIVGFMIDNITNQKLVISWGEVT